MNRDVERPVTAVLGPTNTGKTHLAVERLCGHSSGMIGFPLRLLAREVYDRVVAVKGAARVALITGEERIVPPDARWFLCTAESMPLDRDLAFVALDEAQLGADAERGHVFTDRVLRARGRDETMILGSEALRPMLKALVPGIDIIGRPRFSTLSYAGARKISRLPKRSAIVAFSAEEVYAVAEMLRRLRGGAAVVMGALSPRTRNAQVAMFQSGEVDYLVATDAIGMGLNLDVAHVAFASLAKFDGRRQRRLTVAEMAQIAGRAGRHQRDGSFGALVDQGPGAFGPEEVLAIEQHRFPALDFLYWRNGAPSFDDLDTLIAALEERPSARGLRAAPEATDLAVLKRLADEAWVRDRVRGPAMVARLWAAAGVPDFRKLGIDPHARFVGRLFGHLSEGNGHIPQRWFAEEIARLDNLQGDVETLAGRIAAARSWAYIAHRADWLADPAQMAQRTRDLEQRLSDALHLGLTQRFVDRRTTMLMRQIGAGAAALPVVIAENGSVSVDDQVIGRIDGFAFSVAADARGTDRRRLLASAERQLGDERNRRGRLLAAASDETLTLDGDPAGGVVIRWDRTIGGGAVAVARLAAGATMLCPRIALDRALNGLDRGIAAEISARLDRWLLGQIARALPVLVRLDALRRDNQASPALRAVAAGLIDAGAIAPRATFAAAVDALDPASRKALRAAGIAIGALDLFDPRLLKPKAAGLRRLLIAVRSGCPAGAPPPAGATVLDRGASGAALGEGFRPLGSQAVRVDLIERIARAVHDARLGRGPFVPDAALATSIGMRPDTIATLMATLGFRLFADRRAQAGDGADTVAAGQHWVWRGLDRPVAAAPAVDNAFAALAALVRYG